MRSNHTTLAAALLFLLTPISATAHPHIFAEASLDVVASDDGTLNELRHVWRFDDMFSSSVVLDFDKNTDLKLDHDELEELASTIHESLADYDYFSFMTQDGKPVKIAKPEAIHADFQDGRLLIFFAVKPAEPMQLKGKLTFGVYDPTMYTAIEFVNDTDMKAEGAALALCQHQVVRPDPDEVIAQNQATLTDAFFNDPTGTDMSKLFATRLEFTC